MSGLGLIEMGNIVTRTFPEENSVAVLVSVSDIKRGIEPFLVNTKAV